MYILVAENIYCVVVMFYKCRQPIYLCSVDIRSSEDQKRHPAVYIQLDKENNIVNSERNIKEMNRLRDLLKVKTFLTYTELAQIRSLSFWT